MSIQCINPADHFTLMMDHEIRKSGLAGNYCAIVLSLQGTPSAEALEQKCALFSKQYPEASARLIAQGRRFAWDYKSPQLIPFYHHKDTANEDENATSNLIDDILNASTPVLESAPLELHLIPGQKKSQIILRWYHPICDAKGIELVLHHMLLDTTLESKNQISSISQLINKWSLWQKIKLGLKAKNNIKALGLATSILPQTIKAKPQLVKARTLQFNQDESAQILGLARQHTGLSGTALYFIGCMMRALQNTGRVDNGDAYCVPYAMNLRKRKALFPIFGNQVSFLFAQANRNIVNSRTALFEHLREQNKQAIKQSLDRAMLPLMQAGSWLSLDKYGDIVRKAPDGRERSSFWFSYTGSMDPEPTSIEGCKIINMHQFSQVTAPPSLGLLVNSFQGKLTLSFNYVNNHFDPAWLETLLNNMASELLENDLKQT